MEKGDIKLPEEYHLLEGGSTYPLLPYLVTSDRDIRFLNSKEKQFNYRHSAVRVTIEQYMEYSY